MTKMGPLLLKLGFQCSKIMMLGFGADHNFERQEASLVTIHFLSLPRMGDYVV